MHEAPERRDVCILDLPRLIWEGVLISVVRFWHQSKPPHCCLLPIIVASPLYILVFPLLQILLFAFLVVERKIREVLQSLSALAVLRSRKLLDKTI